MGHVAELEANPREEGRRRYHGHGKERRRKMKIGKGDVLRIPLICIGSLTPRYCQSMHHHIQTSVL
jgi:hypothetical protein